MSSGAQTAHPHSRFFQDTRPNPQLDNFSSSAPSTFPARSLASPISPPSTKRQCLNGSDYAPNGTRNNPPATGRTVASAGRSKEHNTNTTESKAAEDVVSNASASSRTSQAAKLCRACRNAGSVVCPLYKCTSCPRLWHKYCAKPQLASVEDPGHDFVCEKCQGVRKSAASSTASTKRKADTPREQHEAKRPRLESPDRLGSLNGRQTESNMTLFAQPVFWRLNVVQKDDQAEVSLKRLFPTDNNRGVPSRFAGRLRTIGIRSSLWELYSQAIFYGRLPNLWLTAPRHLLTACVAYDGLTCEAIHRARVELFEAVKIVVPPLPKHQPHAVSVKQPPVAPSIHQAGGSIPQPATAKKPSSISGLGQITGARSTGTQREPEALVHPLPPRPPSAGAAQQDSTSGNDDQPKTDRSNGSRPYEPNPLAKAAREGALLKSEDIDRAINRVTQAPTTGSTKSDSFFFRSNTRIEPPQVDRAQAVSRNGEVTGDGKNNKNGLIALVPPNYREQVRKDTELYQSWEQLLNLAGVMRLLQPVIWIRYVAPLMRDSGRPLDQSVLVQAREEMSRERKTAPATTATARTTSNVAVSAATALAQAGTPAVKAIPATATATANATPVIATVPAVATTPVATNPATMGPIRTTSIVTVSAETAIATTNAAAVKAIPTAATAATANAAAVIATVPAIATTPVTTTPTLTALAIVYQPPSPIHGVDTPFSPVPSTNGDTRTASDPPSPSMISEPPQKAATGNRIANANGLNAGRASELTQAKAMPIKHTARRNNLVSRRRELDENRSSSTMVTASYHNKSVQAHGSEEPKPYQANGIRLSSQQPNVLQTPSPSSSHQAACLASAQSSVKRPRGSIDQESPPRNRIRTLSRSTDRGNPRLSSTRTTSRSIQQGASLLNVLLKSSQQQRNEPANRAPSLNRRTSPASAQANIAQASHSVGQATSPLDPGQTFQQQPSIQQAAPTNSASDRATKRQSSQTRKSPTAGLNSHDVPRTRFKDAAGQQPVSPQAPQASPITPISQDRSLSGSDRDESPGKRSNELLALKKGEKGAATNRRPAQPQRNVRSQIVYANRACQTDAKDSFPQQKAPEQAPATSNSAERTSAASRRMWCATPTGYKAGLEAKGVMYEDSDESDEESVNDEPPPASAPHKLPLEHPKTSKDLYEVEPSLHPLSPGLSPKQPNSPGPRKAIWKNFTSYQLQKRGGKFGKDHSHRVRVKPKIPEPLVTVTRMQDHTTDPRRHPLDLPEAVEMQVPFWEFMGLPEDLVFVPQLPELTKKQLVFRDAAKERRWIEAGATRRTRKGVDQQWVYKI